MMILHKTAKQVRKSCLLQYSIKTNKTHLHLVMDELLLTIHTSIFTKPTLLAKMFLHLVFVDHVTAVRTQHRLEQTLLFMHLQ